MDSICTNSGVWCGVAEIHREMPSPSNSLSRVQGESLGVTERFVSARPQSVGHYTSVIVTGSSSGLWGSQTDIVVPRPSPALSTHIRPLCASTIWRQM